MNVELKMCIEKKNIIYDVRIYELITWMSKIMREEKTISQNFTQLKLIDEIWQCGSNVVEITLT